METLREFATAIKVKIKTLTYLIYVVGTDSLYTEFEIEKKYGGMRKISAPAEELRRVQSKIVKYLTTIEKRYFNNQYSYAFTKERDLKNKEKGIINNAAKHRNKKFVINVDLEDYFGTFNFGRVMGFFEKNKHFLFNKELAINVARLVCYKGCLPQGAPTSPIITNLISQILDKKIKPILKKYRLTYTRYADDLTFSTNNKEIVPRYNEFLDELRLIIEDCDFKVNEKKVRMIYKNSRQVVTGLVVNEKVNVTRKYAKDTRAMANSLYKNSSFYIGKNDDVSLNKLEGRFAFIDELSKYNSGEKDETDDGTKEKNLTCNERDYQKYLFYKYFYAHPKPVIICEGNSDIKYLKAALKKDHLLFPTLITKKKSAFTYNIIFIKKQGALKRLLKLGEGATVNNKFYSFFNENPIKTTKNHIVPEGKTNKTKELKGYFNIFADSSPFKPMYPVFFLFDNEINDHTKPIYQFLNSCFNNKKLKNKQKKQPSKEMAEASEKLSKEYIYRMRNDQHVYLLMVEDVDPIKENKKDNDREKVQCTEIEDLFDSALLEVKINNKTFSRENMINKETQYDKKTFSNYVLKNYQTIDFTKFRSIFSNIEKAVQELNDETVEINEN